MRTVYLSASELSQIDDTICCSVCRAPLDKAADNELWMKMKRRYLCSNCARLEDLSPSASEQLACQHAQQIRLSDQLGIGQSIRRGTSVRNLK
ncbi:hypothetical protein AYO47_00305 [Planctomyces sp. SCGC AG-212-M04]|nr:hypothetical protein AYO47_00305 [Planctomyces sp. SCGC AG-212-M04]